MSKMLVSHHSGRTGSTVGSAVGPRRIARTGDSSVNAAVPTGAVQAKRPSCKVNCLLSQNVLVIEVLLPTHLNWSSTASIMFYMMLVSRSHFVAFSHSSNEEYSSSNYSFVIFITNCSRCE